MPKLKKLVEEEVSHTELNKQLAEFAKASFAGGAFFQNEDGSRGEGIEDGDILVPTEATYASGVVERDTQIVAVKVIREAGIVYGAFLSPQGNMGVQFFHPNSFAGKHVEGVEKGTIAPKSRKKVT